MVSSSKKKKKKSSGKKKHASKNYTIKDRRLHKAGFVNISQGSKGCVKCCWCAYYKQYNLEKHFRYDTIESHAQTKHKELLNQKIGETNAECCRCIDKHQKSVTSSIFELVKYTERHRTHSNNNNNHTVQNLPITHTFHGFKRLT